MSTVQEVKIILVEPAGELNLGSVARIMKNMGLQQLLLVNPHCNPTSEAAKIMAVHGIDVLENARIVPSLPVALEGCHRAIATTARPRTLPIKLETPQQALPWLLDRDIVSALIFGPEERGLSNRELNYAQRFVSIPANPEYPSLNLAQAVAICTYELYQASWEKKTDSETISELASLDNLESYYQHLESVLLKINYLYPHTANARMEKFRRLFNRINLQKQELDMLRGILRQVEWSLHHNKE